MKLIFRIGTAILLILTFSSLSEAQCLSDVQSQIQAVQEYQRSIQNVITASRSGSSTLDVYATNQAVSDYDLSSISTSNGVMKVSNGSVTFGVPEGYPVFFPSGALAPF